jgi:hypothetical protein
MKLQLFALTFLSFAVCMASTEGFALFQEDGAEQGTAASEEAQSVRKSFWDTNTMLNVNLTRREIHSRTRRTITRGTISNHAYAREVKEHAGVISHHITHKLEQESNVFYCMLGEMGTKHRYFSCFHTFFWL